MRWSRLSNGVAITGNAAGVWIVRPEPRERFVAMWCPTGLGMETFVTVGTYRTDAAGKRAAKRYAKRLAAAFQAFAKAGWQ
jgi:hypothetical protein